MEEVKTRVEDNIDSLEEEYQLTYPWAMQEAVNQTEEIYKILVSLK